MVRIYRPTPVAADIGALTDNTGEVPDSTIAQVDGALGSPNGGIVALNSLADVPLKTDVEARLDAVNKNFADLTAQINELRTNMRAVGEME